jgi:hypothetical protein
LKKWASKDFEGFEVKKECLYFRNSQDLCFSSSLNNVPWRKCGSFGTPIGVGLPRSWRSLRKLRDKNMYRVIFNDGNYFSFVGNTFTILCWNVGTECQLQIWQFDFLICKNLNLESSWLFLTNDQAYQLFWSANPLNLFQSLKVTRYFLLPEFFWQKVSNF